MTEKSSLQEIESRFDNDVERFSNLDTGQLTTLDAKFNMDLIVESIVRCYPNLKNVLDIGCGAGKYRVRLLQEISSVDIVLSYLSQCMLYKGNEMVGALIQIEKVRD